MSDTELDAKIVFLLVGFVALVAIGYFAVFVVLPILIVLVVVDAFMRASYKGKVREVKAKGGLETAPHVHDFEARLHDGQILIAWLLDLPDQAYMDIYRLQGQTSGDLDDITARGTCIHSTRLELTNSKDDLFIDHDAPEGVLYYIPILHGQRLEKRILDYGFLSFYGRVQFTTRRNSIYIVGQASRVVNETDAKPLALPDDRDDAAVMADDILASIKSRKVMDQQLDAAILRIRQSTDLSDAEKDEAIELLETRAVSP